MRQSLDAYDRLPKAMVNYIRYNGWHFNKEMFEFAVQDFGDPWSKEQIDKILATYGIKLENNTGYDYCYVANMAKMDFFKRSLPSEQYVALFIKDYIDDDDQADGFVFNRFYADCVRKGKPIPWSDVL